MLTLTNEDKNTLILANEDKINPDYVWNDADWFWNDAEGLWELQGLILSKEDKNTLTLSNETKN